MIRHPRRSRRRPLALLAACTAAFGLVAAACGGGDGDSADVTSATSEAPDTAAPGGSEAPPGSDAAPTTTPAETPTPGGKVIMGLEADTSNPWMPAEVLPAISGHQVMSSVFDPMVIPTQDSGGRPTCLESLTPNADHTVWTLKARPGITFHDGTPLDGAALLDNINRFKNSLVTGIFYSNLESAALNPTDPLAVDLTMKSPWVSYPYALLVGAGGTNYIGSPTWMAAADADETLKSKPVGTGPFVVRRLPAQRVLHGQEEP